MRTASSYQNSKLTALLRGVSTGSLQQCEQLFAQVWPAHLLALQLFFQQLPGQLQHLGRNLVNGHLANLDLSGIELRQLIQHPESPPRGLQQRPP